MSSKYKFVNRDGIYFVTATIVDWVFFYMRCEWKYCSAIEFYTNREGFNPDCKETKMVIRNINCDVSDNHLPFVCASIESLVITILF
jgi:hypothetical protein